MSKVVSVRLGEEQHRRLERAAHRIGRTPSAVAALLLEQRLREHEFPGIVIKDTLAGPEAFIEGTRWTVWMIVAWLRAHGDDVAAMADRFDGLMPDHIRRAAAYAAAFPVEIESAILDNQASSDDVERISPGVQIFEARATAS